MVQIKSKYCKWKVLGDPKTAQWCQRKMIITILWVSHPLLADRASLTVSARILRSFETVWPNWQIINLIKIILKLKSDRTNSVSTRFRGEYIFITRICKHFVYKFTCTHSMYIYPRTIHTLYARYESDCMNLDAYGKEL